MVLVIRIMITIVMLGAVVRRSVVIYELVGAVVAVSDNHSFPFGDRYRIIMYSLWCGLFRACVVISAASSFLVVVTAFFLLW